MFIITHRKLFLAIGAFIVIVSAIITLTFGLKLGIDFTGGSLTEVGYSTLPEKALIENALLALELGHFDVRQSHGELGDSYIITGKTLSVEEQQTLETALATLSDDAKVIRNTSVGPVIGEELKDKAIWALGAVLIMIILYVALAFIGVGYPVSSWVYGSMTVLVLFHDILVPLALMSLLGYFLGYEVDVLFVTALLTILGYSVNDTIVIFDRVREKLKEFRIEKRTKVKVPGGLDREVVTYTLTRSFAEIVGIAVRDTMARSINTSLTVLLALLALYLFGSVVTQTFIIILIAGVVAGAYSSIFIASPLLVWYADWKSKKENPA